MSTKSWPKISKVSKNGKSVFLADARLAGKGERKFFSTKAEAETWAQVQRVRRQNQGTGAFDDSELAKFGLTIADAIRFTLEHYRKQAASVPVADAIAALVEAKRGNGRDVTYCRTLASRCGKLLPTFERRALATITTAELDALLATFPVPGTRNTHRRDFCTLWSFAETRGWAQSSVATKTAIAKTVDETPGILTPSHVTDLLSIAAEHEPATVPALALAAFCPLRQSELEKLDWSKVDLEERIVAVDAAVAKTSARRTIHIPENCIEWLRPYARQSGPVMSATYRNAFDRVRVRFGFNPSFAERRDTVLQSLLLNARKRKVKLMDWPDNALRHSAISYRLASTRDIAAVALEAGNSPAIIRRHYLELVKPSAAKAYFGIMPTAPANVVVLPGKAA